jgi:hypothetical protein
MRLVLNSVLVSAAVALAAPSPVEAQYRSSCSQNFLGGYDCTDSSGGRYTIQRNLFGEVETRYQGGLQPSYNGGYGQIVGPIRCTTSRGFLGSYDTSCN